MKALITGINGFVGAHLAEHLLASGDEVAGCVRGSNWRRYVPPSLAGRCLIVDWDLSAQPAKEAQQALIDFAPDCVFHLAAISAPSECGESAPSRAAEAVNVGGTRRVLELAASLPARPRFVLASSCKVYAPMAECNPIVAECAPLTPSDGYGKTKLAAEELAWAASIEHKLGCVIVRAFQHTGPRQAPRFMLPQWAVQIARGGDGPIRVQSLDSYLDISDVRDVVRAYRLLAVSENTAGRVYNVGSGIERRSGDILQRLLMLAGESRSIVASAHERQQHPIADVSRISSDVGWRPQIDLDTTLQDTLDYWRREVRA